MSWGGRLPYAEALHRMEQRRTAILAQEESGGLLLCEHNPVITCGRSSHEENLLLSEEELERRGIELVEIGRGGDLTYHGPGQLMVYPVVRVGVRVSAYLECLAKALGQVAEHYGVVDARWRRDEPGLWLGERKLAACGLHLSRGISIHGYSLNVSTPASDWHCIVPCGLSGPGPISLAEAMPVGRSVPSVAEVAELAFPILRDALAPYGLDPKQSDSLN
jgi:lipoyl(octanoyl) transferase